MGPKGGYQPGVGMTFFGPYSPPPYQDNTTRQAAQSGAAESTQITTTIAKLDQLRLIQTGIFHYAALITTGFHQTAPVDRVGPIEVKLDINFGSRTIGGGNSVLKVASLPNDAQSINATLAIASQSFATGGGDAIFTQTGSAVPLSGTFTIKNINGGTANSLKVAAVFDGPVKDGVGIIENAPRVDGASPP